MGFPDEVVRFVQIGHGPHPTSTSVATWTTESGFLTIWSF